MGLRITDKTQYLSRIELINDKKNVYNNLGDQLSSGQKINQIEQDPIGSWRVMRVDRTLASTNEFSDNIQRGMSFLTTIDSTLNDVQLSLQRARDLTIQAASDTVNQDQKEIIAEEILKIRDSVHEIANLNIDGTYIFAASDLETRPLDSNGLWQQATPVDLRQIWVSQGVKEAFNIDGKRVFDNDITMIGTTAVSAGTIAETLAGEDPALSINGVDIVPVGGLTLVADDADSALVNAINAQTASTDVTASINAGVITLTAANGSNIEVVDTSGLTGLSESNQRGANMYNTLTRISEEMHDVNDPSKTIGDQLVYIDLVIQQVLEGRMLSGLRSNRFEVAESTVQQTSYLATMERANVQDTDIADAMSKLTLTEAALQASYQVTSRILRLNVLDVLR